MSDETVTLRMRCHAETGKAMLLSEDGEEGNAVWIPKSQIVRAEAGRDEDGEFEIKEWMAKKNGLI